MTRANTIRCVCFQVNSLKVIQEKKIHLQERKIILTNGFTMLVGIIFASFSFIAPHLASLKYVFPNGYVNVLGHMSFNSSILLIMLLFVVYYAILYIASLYFYSRLEY